MEYYSPADLLPGHVSQRLIRLNRTIYCDIIGRPDLRRLEQEPPSWFFPVCSGDRGTLGNRLMTLGTAIARCLKGTAAAAARGMMLLLLVACLLKCMPAWVNRLSTGQVEKRVSHAAEWLSASVQPKARG